MLVQEAPDLFTWNLPLPWAFLKHTLICVAQVGEGILGPANWFLRVLILKFYDILFPLHVCTRPRPTTWVWSQRPACGVSVLPPSVGPRDWNSCMQTPPSPTEPSSSPSRVNSLEAFVPSLHHSPQEATDWKQGQDFRWQRRREWKKNEGIWRKREDRANST